MTTRTEPWPAGTPCRVDYGAADVDAAVQFYRAVMGWSVAAPAGGSGGSVLCTVGGEVAAGIGPVAAPGTPPAWLTYVATDDVDATAAAASDAGGIVLAEPVDVADAGRMAVLADPQGAVLGLWQARAQVGAAVVNAPGGFTWSDAAHADTAAARAFYGRVFGWTFDELPGGGPDYRTFSTDGQHPLGGMGALPAEGLTPHWLVYFAVVDTDAVVAAARHRGATVEAGPFDTEFGRIATLTDPWGATFAVMGGGTAA